MSIIDVIITGTVALTLILGLMIGTILTDQRVMDCVHNRRLRKLRQRYGVK